MSYCMAMLWWFSVLEVVSRWIYLSNISYKYSCLLRILGRRYLYHVLPVGYASVLLMVHVHVGGTTSVRGHSFMPPACFDLSYLIEGPHRTNTKHTIGKSFLKGLTKLSSLSSTQVDRARYSRSNLVTHTRPVKNTQAMTIQRSEVYSTFYTTDMM